MVVVMHFLISKVSHSTEEKTSEIYFNAYKIF